MIYTRGVLRKKKREIYTLKISLHDEIKPFIRFSSSNLLFFYITIDFDISNTQRNTFQIAMDYVILLKKSDVFYNSLFDLGKNARFLSDSYFKKIINLYRISHAVPSFVQVLIVYLKWHFPAA